jgi:tRNA threonylcarbamoyladenosine biosynthesis protein TsaE
MKGDLVLNFDLGNIDDTAGKLLEFFPPARIFAFYGEMGAGKTTFIRAVCRFLGVEQNITSPTFTIVNEYQDRDGREIYFHFDFYRVESIGEALDLGYEDYFYSGNTCFIEWPEKIAELLPDETVRLAIDVLDNGSRRLRLISPEG